MSINYRLKYGEIVTTQYRVIDVIGGYYGADGGSSNKNPAIEVVTYFLSIDYKTWRRGESPPRPKISPDNYLRVQAIR